MGPKNRPENNQTFITVAFAHAAWNGANKYFSWIFFPLFSNRHILHSRTELISMDFIFENLTQLNLESVFFLQPAFDGKIFDAFFSLQSKWCSEKVGDVGSLLKEKVTRPEKCSVKNEKYWHCKCTLDGKSSCFIGSKIGYVFFTGLWMDFCRQVKGFQGVMLVFYF